MTEEEEEVRPCTVALDCPSRPSVRTSWTEAHRGRPLGSEDGRIADYVHFRFARAATRVSRRGNKLRIVIVVYARARILGHAERRPVVLKFFHRLAADGGPLTDLPYPPAKSSSNQAIN